MKALDLLRAPPLPLDLFTGRKTFGGNPILGSERLDRLGLHVWRTRLAHRLAEPRRPRRAHLASAGDRAAFAADGFVERRDLLPPEEFRALVAEVDRLEAVATAFVEGDAVTRQMALTPAVLARSPALARLAGSPVCEGLLRYVGSFDRPPCVYVQTIFSRAGGGRTDPQTDLHVDTFHPTVKAWLFLEDVGPQDGPFRDVPGSHRPTALRLALQKRRSVIASRPGGPKGGAFRIREADLARQRLPAPRAFAVPANTLVVGDTSGIHGRTATDRPHRRIEIRAFSRTNPFRPFADHPWWRIPGIAGREKAACPAGKALAQRLGARRFRSLVVGRVGPRDDVRLARGRDAAAA